MLSTVTPTSNIDNINEEFTPDDHLHLPTIYWGQQYIFDQDWFVPKRQQVVECDPPPPVKLQVGLKVVVEGMRGKLMKIHKVKMERVQFLLWPHK
jgi:hypothetical protein